MDGEEAKREGGWRGQRELQNGGEELKPNNDLQLERWRGRVFVLGIGKRTLRFVLTGKRNVMRAGMRSETVCERREARMKDLFNKLKGKRRC